MSVWSSSSTVNILFNHFKKRTTIRLPKTSSSSCRLPRTTSKRKHPRASTRASAAWSWKAGRSSSTTKTGTSDGRSRARRKDVRFLFVWFCVPLSLRVCRCRARRRRGWFLNRLWRRRRLVVPSFVGESRRPMGSSRPRKSREDAREAVLCDTQRRKRSVAKNDFEGDRLEEKTHILKGRKMWCIFGARRREYD